MNVLAVPTSIKSALSFSVAEITCLTHVNRTVKFCREQTVRLIIKVDDAKRRHLLQEQVGRVSEYRSVIVTPHSQYVRQTYCLRHTIITFSWFPFSKFYCIDQ
jgi:hypothetical protein